MALLRLGLEPKPLSPNLCGSTISPQANHCETQSISLKQKLILGNDFSKREGTVVPLFYFPFSFHLVWLCLSVPRLTLES